MGFNQVRAGSAAVLIVNIAQTIDDKGEPMRWGQYDPGQAVAHFSVQAHHDRLHVHQMGGITVDGLRETFSIADGFEPISVTVIEHVAAPEELSNERLREREVAPRTRKALEEIILVNA